MNKLSSAERSQVVAALVEGNSIRSTCRMTGFSKKTVVKLLVDLGRACEAYQRETLVGLRYATEFINDLAGRLGSRVQITTDGHKVCAEVIEGAFGCDVD